MTGRHPPDGIEPATRSTLVEGLTALGVESGDTVMLHTSMRALGWVVGGPETIVRALLDVIGPEGTLMAYAGWDQDPYHLDRWPEAIREGALAEQPGFDAAISEANREHGRLPERLRTWPGAVRGSHPEASMVAVGRLASWLVDPHPSDDAYGLGSPLERLVQARGTVLMLGAPLGTMTLLHHAEALAQVPGKARVSYRAPVAHADGTIQWRTFHDFNTSGGVLDYASVLGEGVDEFEAIVRDALASDIGTQRPIGASTSVLVDAEAIVSFAITWLEVRFAGTPDDAGRAGAPGRTRL